MLQEAGFPQEAALFYWDIDSQEDPGKLRSATAFERDSAGIPTGTGMIPARTAEEILGRLPERVDQMIGGQKAVDYLRICPCEEGWHVYYKNDHRGSKRLRTRYSFKSDTLANAAAQMYVYLAKNGLLPTP